MKSELLGNYKPYRGVASLSVGCQRPLTTSFCRGASARVPVARVCGIQSSVRLSYTLGKAASVLAMLSFLVSCFVKEQPGASLANFTFILGHQSPDILPPAHSMYLLRWKEGVCPFDTYLGRLLWESYSISSAYHYVQ